MYVCMYVCMTNIRIPLIKCVLERVRDSVFILLILFSLIQSHHSCCLCKKKKINPSTVPTRVGFRNTRNVESSEVILLQSAVTSHKQTLKVGIYWSVPHNYSNWTLYTREWICHTQTGLEMWYCRIEDPCKAWLILGYWKVRLGMGSLIKENSALKYESLNTLHHSTYSIGRVDIYSLWFMQMWWMTAEI